MKKHIIDEITSATGVTVAEAERQIDIVTNAVKAAILKNDEVRFGGVGTFKKKFRDSRQGRNPQTGETITIGARHVVAFKAAKNLI